MGEDTVAEEMEWVVVVGHWGRGKGVMEDAEGMEKGVVVEGGFVPGATV